MILSADDPSLLSSLSSSASCVPSFVCALTSAPPFLSFPLLGFEEEEGEEEEEEEEDSLSSSASSLLKLLWVDSPKG